MRNYMNIPILLQAFVTIMKFISIVPIKGTFISNNYHRNSNKCHYQPFCHDDNVRRSDFLTRLFEIPNSSNTNNNGETISTTSIETTIPVVKQHRRRQRYSGRYPRNFQDKYKEINGDEQTIQKVLSKGMTPAGTHVPIMVKECLYYMGLHPKVTKDLNNDNTASCPLLVVDCTLGYGGHSSFILKCISERNDGSSLISFDQDTVEIQKTEERLRMALHENRLPSLINIEKGSEDNYGKSSLPSSHVVFTAVNQNFSTLGSYLSSTNQTQRVTSLLADLGLSSMQIDDNQRGFTYKRDGPLDMRMNPNDQSKEKAYDLLKRLRPRQLKSLLKENSDEDFAAEIAVGLIGDRSKIPKTTIELASRVRDIAQPLIEKKHKQQQKEKQQQKQKTSNRKTRHKQEMKKLLDSTVARVMQAIRIQVNGEFEALEELLEDLPNILAPGGKAVFLTFHSGEDRRVKKSFKNGFKNGIYSAWSKTVVRPSTEEKRNNPRSSCCKLRWAIRSDND